MDYNFCFFFGVGEREREKNGGNSQHQAKTGDIHSHCDLPLSNGLSSVVKWLSRKSPLKPMETMLSPDTFGHETKHLSLLSMEEIERARTRVQSRRRTRGHVLLQNKPLKALCGALSYLSLPSARPYISSRSVPFYVPSLQAQPFFHCYSQPEQKQRGEGSAKFSSLNSLK